MKVQVPTRPAGRSGLQPEPVKNLNEELTSRQHVQENPWTARPPTSQGAAAAAAAPCTSPDSGACPPASPSARLTGRSCGESCITQHPRQRVSDRPLTRSLDRQTGRCCSPADTDSTTEQPISALPAQDRADGPPHAISLRMQGTTNSPCQSIGCTSVQKTALRSSSPHTTGPVPLPRSAGCGGALLSAAPARPPAPRRPHRTSTAASQRERVHGRRWPAFAAAQIAEEMCATRAGQPPFQPPVVKALGRVSRPPRLRTPLQAPAHAVQQLAHARPATEGGLLPSRLALQPQPVHAATREGEGEPREWSRPAARVHPPPRRQWCSPVRRILCTTVASNRHTRCSGHEPG